MKQIKLISLFLLSIVFVLPMASCGNDDEDEPNPGYEEEEEEVVSDLAPETLLIGQHIRWYQSGHSISPYDDHEIVNSTEVKTNYSSYLGEYAYRKTSANTAILSMCIYQPVSSTYRMFDIYAKLEFKSKTELKVTGSVSIFSSFDYSTYSYSLNCNGTFVP